MDIKSANNSGKCFLNCITASVYTNELKALLGGQYNSVKYDEEIYKQYYSKIKCNNVNFPVGLKDIKILEENNPFIRFHIWSLKGADYFLEYKKKLHHITNFFLKWIKVL